MEPIMVWEFYKAPEHLRVLSGHGGDEDWVIVAQEQQRNSAEELADRLAVCDYSTHTGLWNGKPVLVYICAHA